VSWWALGALLLPGQPGEAEPVVPWQLPVWAAADQGRLAPPQRRHVRYLSLWTLPQERRATAWRVLSGHVNGLSRGISLVPVEVVPGTGESLARVDLRRLRIDPDTWDRLADPYTWVKGYHEHGRWEDRERYYPAPWLVRTRAAYDAYYRLREYAGNPITDGVWFLWQTGGQQGRGGLGYADFLGVKRIEDFEKLVRLRRDEVDDLRHFRNVLKSGIALEPRRVEVHYAALGKLWLTKDQEFGKAVKTGNPLRVLDDDFTFAASEAIGNLPNGFPAFGLFDGKGAAVEAAPNNVVQENWATGRRKKALENGITCWECHTLRPDEDILKKLSVLPLRGLRAYDLAKLEELQDRFTREVEPLVEQERRGYHAAVKRVTDGWTPHEYGKELARLFGWYEDLDADGAFLGRVLGYGAEEVREALLSHDRRTKLLDPVLSALVPEGGTVPARQLEEVFHVAYEVLREGRKKR
jgi:hypothetical protein